MRDGTLAESDRDTALGRLDILAGSWSELQPTPELRQIALGFLKAHPLKAADALQLAAAERWRGSVYRMQEFVCLDKTLRTAAAEEGFQVLPN